MWDSTASSCKQTCSFYSDTGSCTAQTMCLWDEKTNLCRKQCSFDMTPTECTNDPSCDWLASRNGTKCAQKCVFRYQQQSSCSLDPECMWDNVNARCTDSCTRLTSAQCATNNLCVQDPTYGCVEKCSTRYSSSAACNADTSCHWDASLQSCQALCNIIGNNQAACEQSALCVWSGYTCKATCGWLNTTMGSCPSSECNWNALTGECVAQCTSYTGVTAQANCNANPSCEWIASTNTCNGKCPTLNQDTCRTTASCMWDPSVGTCKPNCARAGSEASCKAETMCLWTGGSCATQCKYAYSDKTSCESNTACSWTGSACSTSCQNTNSQADCNARTDCIYDANSKRCSTVLQSTNEQCSMFSQSKLRMGCNNSIMWFKVWHSVLNFRFMQCRFKLHVGHNNTTMRRLLRKLRNKLGFLLEPRHVSNDCWNLRCTMHIRIHKSVCLRQCTKRNMLLQC